MVLEGLIKKMRRGLVSERRGGSDEAAKVFRGKGERRVLHCLPDR